ncbi:MAG: B-box zinc finger protein, partial [Deltaproteobacteria bacterium]|nr:B-box zinc finger protein [Deltaproteobacteria bacterium]
MYAPSAELTASLERCSTHGDRIAGWRCTQCARALCPACTARKPVGAGHVDVCELCGGVAEAIRRRRADIAPFPKLLRGALEWPLRREAVVVIFAMALFEGFMSLWGPMAASFGYAIELSYLYQVVRHTALGEDHVPGPDDFRGFFEDIVDPVGRMLLASIWLWMPAVWWAVFTLEKLFANTLTEESYRQSLWLPILLSSMGALIFPMAVVGASLQGPALQLLNPVALLVRIARIGKDYWICAGVCIALAVSQSLTGFVLAWAMSPLPGVLSGFVSDFVLLYPTMMGFRAMGLLVRTHGDVIEYGRESDYYVPVIAEAPERTLQAVESAHRQSASGGALVEAEEPVAPIDLAQAAQIEPATQLAVAWTQGDVEGALDTFARAGREIAARTLSAEAWMKLGEAMRGRAG